MTSRRPLFAAALSLLPAAAPAADAPKPLVFEAEDVSGPADAWEKNKSSATKWNLWSTDTDAAKKWSGGVVLQSPPVKEDRATPEEGAPPLHTRITGIPNGRYDVFIKMGRTLGISRDGGKTWSRLTGGALGAVEIKDGTFELWVDDRFTDTGNPGSAYYDSLTFTPLPPPVVKLPAQGFATIRVRERLDRGLVALRRSANEVYLSWRLLADDPPDAAFHVYRADVGGAPQRVTTSPVTKTADFTDAAAPEGACTYVVRPVAPAGEGPASPPAAVPAGAAAQDYVAIPLDPGTRVQKIGVGDLDGDGRYDFVLKTPDENIDPYEQFWQKSPGTYSIEARSHDGRLLWKKDLGWAIERGMWYSPMIVYDFNGDGKAEVAAKTGEGDPRDPDGRVQSGPEWVTVWEGATGKEIARAPWPPREVHGEKISYNYASRNQIGVAYLDGKTPCLIAVRGTYTTIQVHAWQLAGGQLKPVWTWNSLEEAEPRRWRGQGAHTLQAHDVDGDGRDEVVLGSAVLDDNGVGLWSTGLGHPDHCYVGKIDPARPGLQIFYGMETAQKAANGLCVADAKTGAILWGHKGATRHVHGHGLCADIDDRYPGVEVFGCDTDAEKKFTGGWLYSARGELIEETKGASIPSICTFWDGDTLRELLVKSRLRKYRGEAVGTTEIAGRVALIADVLGDWREELITTRPGELRIYTTSIPAMDRRACLMQDPVYRNTVAAAAQGYFYNPMLSYWPGAAGGAKQ
jgi:rhamnogalacturonan endolyase